ncbi:MAG: hypothetical protein ACREUT_16080 [Steroidobacteraceae bacterium]
MQWKNFDWDAMERLQGKGFITRPGEQGKVRRVHGERIERIGEILSQALRAIGHGMKPKLNGLRNFTVRLMNSELQRVETKASKAAVHLEMRFCAGTSAPFQIINA